MGDLSSLALSYNSVDLKIECIACGISADGLLTSSDLNKKKFKQMYKHVRLTLARVRCFAIFASGGGGGMRPPLAIPNEASRRRASRKKTLDCSPRVLAIGYIIFGHKSIVDPVMAGQIPNYRKFHFF